MTPLEEARLRARVMDLEDALNVAVGLLGGTPHQDFVREARTLYTPIGHCDHLHDRQCLRCRARLARSKERAQLAVALNGDCRYPATCGPTQPFCEPCLEGAEAYIRANPTKNFSDWGNLMEIQRQAWRRSAQRS